MPFEAFKRFTVFMLMGLKRCDRKQRRDLKRCIRDYTKSLDTMYPMGQTEDGISKELGAGRTGEQIVRIAPQIIIPRGVNPEALK